MSYSKVEFGALMLQNKDGSFKKSPDIFRPMNREPTLKIPPEGNEHARPLIRLTSDDYRPIMLMFYPDRIVATQGDKTKTIMNFDFDDFEID